LIKYDEHKHPLRKKTISAAICSPPITALLREYPTWSSYVLASIGHLHYPKSNMGAIDISGVTKTYKQLTALDNISLEVESGSFFGLLGPNGAGKSTLMFLISGFLPQDSGTIRLNGSEIKPGDSQRRHLIGLVPQELAIYPTLNALENLHIFGKLYRLSKTQIKERSEAFLKAVDLWDRRKEPVKQFSGGMKRRLNLIVGLLHQPPILLCDEPTVGVDPQSRNAIFEFLEEQNRRGLTIVYTTHYMEEAERLCDRIAIIDHGTIKAAGTRQELIALTGQRYELRFPAGEPAKLQKMLDHPGKWEQRSDHVAFLPEGNVSLSSLFKSIEAASYPEDQVRIQQPSLERVFLSLTGRQLRD